MASSSEVRAGGAFVELYAKGSAAVQKAIEGVGAALKKIGFQTALVSTMLAAGAGAIVTPFVHGLQVASEWGASILDSSRRAGMGFEQTQALAYALRVSMEELGATTGHMDSFLQQAANGSAEASQALNLLGLSFQDLQGMTNDERIRRFADALNNVADAAQRGALQRQIFGRGGLSLNVAGGAAGLREREQHGREIGAVMDRGDLERVAQYNAVLRDMNISIKALWASVGQAALTPMMEFFEIVTNVAGAVRRWVNENRASLETVFRVADAIGAAAAVFTALAGVIYGAGVAAGFFAPAASLVTGIVGILWGALTFAATGFGLLTVAGWAWSAGTVAASALAAAAVWGFSTAFGLAATAAAAVGGVAAWGFSAAWTAAAWAASMAASAASLAWAAVSTGISWAWSAAGIAASLAWSAAMIAASGVAELAMLAWPTIATAAMGIFSAAFTAGMAAWVTTGSIGFAALTAASAAWAAGTALAASVSSVAMGAWATATTLASMIAGTALWGWVVSTVSGFTVAGAASMAWAGIVAVASAIAGSSLWANTIGTWLLAAGTIAYKVAALAATVATFLFSLSVWDVAAAVTVATAGLNILAAALAVVTAAAVLAGISISAAFVFVPLLAAAAIAFTGLMFAARDTGQAIVNAIGGAVDQASSAFARLGESGWRVLGALGNAFTELYGTARQAFAGIYDAMRAGDFQLAWEIVQTAGLLAWEKIKTRGVEIFETVSDFIEDAMREAFAGIQSLWARLKAELIAGALEVGATMLTALNPGSATIEERARLMMLHAADLRAGNAGPTSEGWRDAQARIDEEREQAQREAERARLNRAREAALERGDQSEADRLQLRLNALVSQAAVAAGAHDFERARRGALPGEPGAGEIQGGGLKLSGGPTGTFMGDAQAASRMFGAGDIAHQQLATAREQLRVEQEQLAELRRREGGEAPEAAAPEAPEPVIDRDPGGFRNRRDLLAPGGGDEDTVPNAGGSPLSRILGIEPPDMSDDFADAMQVMEASFSGFADRIAASLPGPGQLAPMPGIGSDGNGGAAEGVVSSDIGGALLAEMRQQTGAIQQQTRDMIAALDRAGGLEVS